MGEWKETEISYLKPTDTFCTLCGHPIATRYWAAEVEGAERPFCSPEHEARYHSYWLPRYGKAV
jgi:hypothetical protein